MLRKGLGDGDNAVRVRALRAITGMVPVLESKNEIQLLRPLIEPAVKVIGFCVENNFTSDAIDTLDLFNDLLQEPEMDIVLDGYMQPLFQFMIGIVRNTELDLALRDVALSFIQNLASMRTKQFLSQNWLQPTLESLCFMFREPLEEDIEADDLTAQRIAIGCVDVLCAAIPEKYIGPAILNMCAALQKSPNWLERKACLETLATCSIGCFVFMREHLNEYLPALKQGFADPQVQVRESACVTLAHFCEQLQDPVVEKHEELVPLLANAMKDKETVAMRALYALQFFSEQLGEGFLVYSDGFMTGCLTFAANGSPLIKDTAIGAIGSIAVAIGKPFVKYLGPVVEMLRAFMAVRQEEMLTVRARATEVAGSVCNAVGKEAIGQNLLGEFNRLAFEGLQIESDHHQYELRTTSYGYFANLADVLDADFLPLFQNLYPFLMATIESNEGVMGSVGDSSGLESLVEDDEEDLAGEKVNFSVQIPFVEEKKTAIVLIAALSQVLGKHMAAYVEKFLPKLIELCDFIHSDIREAAVTALPSMMHIINDAFPNPAGKWEKGKFSNVRPLTQQCSVLLGPVMGPILDVAREDRSPEAVCCAIEAMAKIFVELGPASMEPHIKEVIGSLVMVFDKQAYCQALREQFDEDERDLEVFNSAVDCCVDMMRVAGPTPFGAEIFRVIYPKMRVLYGNEQPDSYRALALGALAEFSVHLENGIAPCAQDMLKMALAGPNAEDVVIRRNACYCMGAVVQFGGDTVVGAIPQVLSALQHFLKGDDNAGVDNAVGSLARIVLTGNANLPLQDMINAIFAHLPLKADVEPYGPLFQAIIKLIRSPASNLIVPQLPLALKTALFALLNDKQPLDARSKPAVEVFIRFIGMGEQKGLLQQAIQNLPAHKQAQLKERMNL
jgi:hypothetical protein